MTTQTKKHVVIDTNIFLHLLNPQINTNSHIDHMLIILMKQHYLLAIDDSGRIKGEYLTKIMPMLKNSSDTDILRFILKYWMSSEQQEEIAVDKSLLAWISKAIPCKHDADRFVVALSWSVPCELITNDQNHIIDHRDKLKKEGKRRKTSVHPILTSQEAHSKLAQV